MMNSVALSEVTHTQYGSTYFSVFSGEIFYLHGWKITQDIMNTSGLELYYYFSVTLFYLCVLMDMNNLISIHTTEWICEAEHDQQQHVSANVLMFNGPTTYNRFELLAVRERVYHNSILRILPVETCLTIRNLWLNKRRKRGKRGGIKVQRRSVNLSNIINIKSNIDRNIINIDEQVSLLLLNAQSVKNKDLNIRSCIDEYKAEVTIVTESWLTEDDSLWVMRSELNNNGVCMQTVNRKGRKVGGLAIIYKNNIKVKKVKSGSTRSFEYGMWNVQMKNITLNVLAIYRPPRSEVNNITLNMFMADITEFLIDVLTKDKNVLIMGDINIHINNQEDQDACTLVKSWRH